MNLINAFKELAGDQIADLAGNFIGASSAETSSAMDNILPAVLGGVLGKVTDEESAGGLLDFLGNNDLGGGLLDNIGDLFGSSEASGNLLGLGGTALKFLMGDRTEAVIDLLTKVTGMDNTKMGSLIKIAAPLLLSFIGKKASSDNLGAGGLLSLLNSQKDYVKESAPAGLLGSLGLGALTDTVGKVASSVGAGVGSAADKVTDVGGQAVEAGKSGFQKLLPWLVLILAALGLFWLLRGCGGDVTDAANSAMDKTEQMAGKAGDAVKGAAAATEDAVKGAAEATGDAVKGAAEKAGDMAESAGDAVADMIKSFKLPNGMEIKTQAGSFVNNMYAYLSGDEVDAKKRFTFDGVNFKTGSAALTAESSTQLDNLVALMNAYENMAIRVEGHTDNTGNAEANMKLSNQRALSVKKYLMDASIAAGRVAAEGMGQTQPVADNGTDEGRAQNRRVDVYVTKK